MVSIVLRQLEALICRSVSSSGRSLSHKTATTLIIALAKLNMTVPHELHIVLLQSLSNHLEVSRLEPCIGLKQGD